MRLLTAELRSQILLCELLNIYTQGSLKVDRPDDADTTERFQSRQMAVAGNDQVSLAFEGALQDPVVIGVSFNYFQPNLGNHDISDSAYQFELGDDLGFLPP